MNEEVRDDWTPVDADTGEADRREPESILLQVPDLPDSGTRREFSTGAVRDMAEGKGRCDLLPLREVAELLDNDSYLHCIADYMNDPDDLGHLYRALHTLCDPTAPHPLFKSMPSMMLELAKHFEAGAAKYGDRNWEAGLPAKCYIDSAVRHYLKYLDGWKDEPHYRATAWNVLCCIWELKHHDQSIYKEEHNGKEG